MNVPSTSAEGPDLDERIERWLFVAYPAEVAAEVKSAIKRGLLTAIWDQDLKMADIRPIGQQGAANA